MKDISSRRSLLKKSFLTAGTFFIGSSIAKANSCLLTPEQTEGPFYPIEDQKDKNNDLTFVNGSNKKAKGEVIVLYGVVKDQDCKPVKDVLVEIWQACVTGKYNHPGDPNPAKLDPNFQYWGQALTNERGEYQFKTILPGHYKATNTWTRPAHIHMKVHRRGFEELTTQVYFKGDPYNAKDRVLQSLSAKERENVIVDLKNQKDQLGDIIKGPRSGRFDITIRSL